jgi:hypothetical protein
MVVSERKKEPSVSAPVALRIVSDVPTLSRSPSPGPCTTAGIAAASPTVATISSPRGRAMIPVG